MTEAESLEAEKANILATLGRLATVIDASEGGRSLSASASRASLTERLNQINERLAQLSGPFIITSRGTR